MPTCVILPPIHVGNRKHPAKQAHPENVSSANCQNTGSNNILSKYRRPCQVHRATVECNNDITGPIVPWKRTPLPMKFPMLTTSSEGTFRQCMCVHSPYVSKATHRPSWPIRNMAAEHVSHCRQTSHTPVHTSQHSKLCFPYGSKRGIHPHHSKVAIVVSSNHHLVYCCNAVDFDVTPGRGGQA